MSSKEPVKLIIKSDGTSYNTQVALSNGVDLGAVRSVTWTCAVGGFAKATIETCLTAAQLEALVKDTDITVINKK